jgi:hypothetical protein
MLRQEVILLIAAALTRVDTFGFKSGVGKHLPSLIFFEAPVVLKKPPTCDSRS